MSALAALAIVLSRYGNAWLIKVERDSEGYLYQLALFVGIFSSESHWESVRRNLALPSMLNTLTDQVDKINYITFSKFGEFFK